MSRKKRTSKSKKPKQPPEQKSAGRPSLFKPQFSEKALALYGEGAIDKEVAEQLGVNADTVYEWANKYPEFSEARRRGKALANQMVEKALFQRAIGYTCDDVHVAVYEGCPILTPLKKHYPPDPTSIIFFLKNRDPAQWRDKIEATVSGTVSVDPKLLAAAQAIAKKL